MSEPNLAYEDDIDEALASWERVSVKENEERKRKDITRLKEALLYSNLVAIVICERVSSGELLINICRDDDMPTVRRVTQWLRNNQDFAALFKESIQDRLNIFEEEIIQISDDVKHDFREVVRGGKTVRVVDGDAIARAKLRVETRLKHLRAYRPERWSETSTLITRSEDDVSGLSDEELAKRIAELNDKNSIVNDERDRKVA